MSQAKKKKVEETASAFEIDGSLRKKNNKKLKIATYLYLCVGEPQNQKQISAMNED